MRSNCIFISPILVTVLVLLAGCSNTTGAVPETDQPLDVRAERIERVEAQIDVGAFRSATGEPVVSRATSEPDGPAFLEKHCARCHEVQWLEEIKKPVADWELTLTQMETMGVHLSDSEKVELLNYLSDTQEP